MDKDLKEILERCNLAYSKGDLYTLNGDDWHIIANTLDLYPYDMDTDVVDDFLYDTLYAKAKEKWPEDEFFNKLTSENTGYGQDVIHEYPMGSMEELKEGDLKKWVKDQDQFVISDKLDGCSIILTYRDEDLIMVATRGHGIKGKDIIRHAKYIPNIPQKLPGFSGPFTVRGELIFKKNKIEDIINHLESIDGKRQKNGRNTIAGALNRKETNKYIFENCNFVAYWTSSYKGTLEAFQQLDFLGFETPFHELVAKDTLTDENMIETVKTRLKSSDYELDGIIITQEDHIDGGFVGGTINPKCSRKFKIGVHDNEAVSTVVGINWQISRWGVFTPVLKIEPVEVAGALISNITAHNYDNVIKSKCGIGAKIRFKRAGLVIPKLEEVLIPSEEYDLPKCKTRIDGVDLIFDENEELWYNNPNIRSFIFEKDIQALEYLGKKLEIDQLGYGNCSKLYLEFVNEFNSRLMPPDLFNISDNFFINVIGKNGEKLANSLNSKRNSTNEVKMAAACGSFGPDIGERILQIVWDKYGTLENMDSEKLYALDGFAEARVNQYLKNQAEWTRYKEFLSKLVNFSNSDKKLTSNNLKNYVICFTGIRDKNFMKYVNENGGIATDKWKSEVTHLVVKDKSSTSSKVVKAEKAGIPILTLEEIYKETGYVG